MKFTSTKKAILSALAVVEPHAGDHIKICSGSMSATNYSRSSWATFPISGDFENGQAATSLETFSKSFKTMKAEEFTLSTVGNNLEIKAGKSRFKIPFLPADTFPATPMLDQIGDISFEIDASILERLATEVGFAVSGDITRPMLAGVNWQSSGDGDVTFTATSGNMLSSLSQSNIQAGPFDIIVPPFTLPKFSHDQPVAVTIHSERFIRLERGGLCVASKLIDGKFPDFKRFIPKGYNHLVVLSREDFLSSVQRASVYISGKWGTSVRMSSIDGQEMKIVAQGDNGEIEDAIGCVGNLPGITIANRVLLPVLSSMKGDKIEMHVTNDGTGVVLLDPDAPERMNMVMPLKDGYWQNKGE